MNPNKNYRKLQQDNSLSQLEELESIGIFCVQAVKDFTET